MPDRRQHDRREGNGIQSKHITISFTTFISLIVIFFVIFVSIISCIVVYKIGYNNGFEEGLMEYNSYTITDDDFETNQSTETNEINTNQNTNS